eukprot:CAMPEP_0204228912 /NCGR_PEP_ID=MMETSP0361-20130328/86801_1 /ASSEMBLY_ACC=CAM_ASM_000343 /TAXON_ID=268821 /ORGANISM="Scrippsiella Hangoei, Strain SHTV-5" /LENGTH=33 /DNA_ID= /DNA_START= /DNA_END= /DNA_ORIENTATION=
MTLELAKAMADKTPSKTRPAENFDIRTDAASVA